MNRLLPVALICLMVAVVGAALIPSPPIPPPTTAPAPAFYNSLNFKNQPYLGVPTVTTIPQSSTGSQAVLTEAIRWALISNPKPYALVIDVETQTDLRAVAKGWITKAQLDINIAANVRILQWSRAAINRYNPSTKLGFFCFPMAWPLYDITDLPNGQADYPTFIASQNYTAASLAGLIDIACPEVYPRQNFEILPRVADPVAIQKWRNDLIMTVAECQRVMPGKPICPFLTFQYVSGGDVEEMVDKPVPGPALLEMVRCSRTFGATPIVWGGWGSVWNPKAEWWTTLKGGI